MQHYDTPLIDFFPIDKARQLQLHLRRVDITSCRRMSAGRPSARIVIDACRRVTGIASSPERTLRTPEGHLTHAAQLTNGRSGQEASKMAAA